MRLSYSYFFSPEGERVCDRDPHVAPFPCQDALTFRQGGHRTARSQRSISVPSSSVGKC